jgi:hypothetical protein
MNHAVPTSPRRVGDRGDAVRQLQAGLNRDYPAYSKLVVGRHLRAGDRSRDPRVPASRGIARRRRRRLLHTGEARGFSTEQNGDQDCGEGVYAGPNTSCQFAKNAREKYFSVLAVDVIDRLLEFDLPASPWREYCATRLGVRVHVVLLSERDRKTPRVGARQRTPELQSPK